MMYIFILYLSFYIISQMIVTIHVYILVVEEVCPPQSEFPVTEDSTLRKISKVEELRRHLVLFFLTTKFKLRYYKNQ